MLQVIVMNVSLPHETKRASKEWCYTSLLKSKKSSSIGSWMVILFILWDINSGIVTDFIQKGSTWKS